MINQNPSDHSEHTNTSANTNNGNTLKSEIIELNRNLALLTRANRKRNVVLRGLLNGVFTAIGASLGFALFITNFSNFLQSAESVPFFDRIIERSNLEEIIQSYQKDFERPDPTETPKPTPTLTPIPSPTLTPEPTVEPKPQPTVITTITPTV